MMGCFCSTLKNKINHRIVVEFINIIYIVLNDLIKSKSNENNYYPHTAI